MKRVKGMRVRGTRAAVYCVGLLLLGLLMACGGAVATPASAVRATATMAQVASSAPVTSAAPVASPTRAASPGASGAATPVGTPVGTPGTRATPATPVATPRGTVYPLTVRDDAGRSVTVRARPQKIVSLAPSNTEIVYALGLGDRVVGVDQFSNYPPEAAAKPKIGSYSSANLEEVIARDPDLILASGITRPDVLTALESRGLTVIVLAPSDLPGVLASIALVGQVADVGTNAATLRGDLEARIASVAQRVQGTTTRPRTFVELDPTLFFSVGPKSFVDDLIARAGGVNIAADSGTPFPQLSQEQILAQNPEVILLGDGSQGVTPESVKARAGWGGVSAVQSGRIIVLDEDVFFRPGPRAVEALEALLRYLHPELFR